MLGAVAALAVVAVGAVVLTRDGGGDPPASAAPDGATEPEQPQLLALQVDGGPAPMLAVVGVPPDGGDPFVMPLSSELTVVMPGQGETSAAGVTALPPESMRVAMSNMSGLWIDHYAALGLRELASAIDAAGGVTATLPEAYPITDGVLGPGEVTMTGAQAKAFLAGATDDAGVRWEILLSAMLADPPALAGPGVDTDDAEAVNALLADAQGAEVLEMPTERVTSTIVVPVYPALDELLSGALGTQPPVPAIVQNGSGEPGVGEEVAVRIIPAGFRVVLSQNAQTFDVTRTDVFANGPDHEGEARTLREALGVGRVRVAAVPSNVGDITIVVGEDFTA